MTPPGYERRHGQTEWNGTWEALADHVPAVQAGKEKRLAHKETKLRAVGRVADETVVPTMLCESRVEERVSAECPKFFGKVFQRNNGVCIAEAIKHEYSSGVSEEAIHEGES
jgi:hypothetical protein